MWTKGKHLCNSAFGEVCARKWTGAEHRQRTRAETYLIFGDVCMMMADVAETLFSAWKTNQPKPVFAEEDTRDTKEDE